MKQGHTINIEMLNFVDMAIQINIKYPPNGTVDSYGLAPCRSSVRVYTSVSVKT